MRYGFNAFIICNARCICKYFFAFLRFLFIIRSFSHIFAQSKSLSSTIYSTHRNRQRKKYERRTPSRKPMPAKATLGLDMQQNNRPGQIAAFRFSRHICIGFDSLPQNGYTDFARFSELALPYIAKPKAPLPMQKAAWRLNQFPRKNAGKEGMHGLFSGNRR